MRTSIAISISLITLAALSGCSSQPPAQEQAAAAPAAAPAPAPAAPVVAAPVAKSAPDPYGLDALKDPNSPLAKRNVYFDYDKYNIKDEFKPLIEHHAKFLVKNGQMKMLLQGNADERGSREYNLALGQKRANAVKSALITLGAKEGQIESVSLGEEKPVCTEHAESCWWQNRRGQMLYSGEF